MELSQNGTQDNQFSVKEGRYHPGETPGAGGYDDPMKREPEKVLRMSLRKGVCRGSEKKIMVWLLYQMEFIIR